MEAAPNSAPLEPKKRNLALRIFMMICGAIVLLLGIMQVWQGVKQIKGGDGDPQMKTLLTESDAAVEEGQRLLGEGAPQFRKMMTDVDALGLEAFRAQQQEAAAKTSEAMRKSVEQFRLGEKKINEARALNENDKLTAFLEAKSRSYDLWAQTIAINGEMVQLVLDPSIATIDALIPQVTAASARYKEMEAKATAATKESNEIMSQIKADTKK